MRRPVLRVRGGLERMMDARAIVFRRGASVVVTVRRWCVRVSATEYSFPREARGGRLSWAAVKVDVNYKFGEDAQCRSTRSSCRA